MISPVLMIHCWKFVYIIKSIIVCLLEMYYGNRNSFKCIEVLRYLLDTLCIFLKKPLRLQSNKISYRERVFISNLISMCIHKSKTNCSCFVWKLSRKSDGVFKIQGSNETFRTSLIKSKHWYQRHVETLYSVLNPFDTLIQNKINTGKVWWNT